MTTKTTPNMREKRGAGVVARYGGCCTRCGKWIYAQTRKQWQRAVRQPCPYCGRQGW